MKYVVTFWLFCYFSAPAELAAQSESVHLSLDKVVAYPGDTVWFRALVFNNQFLSSLSTNLYIDLYNDSSKVICQQVIPLFKGMSAGQILIPKLPGCYWLRSYTSNSGNFMTSLTVRDPHKPLVVRRLEQAKGIYAVTDTGRLLFSLTNTEHGISAAIYQDTVGRYAEQPFVLRYKYYDTIAGQYPFQLRKNHNRNFLFPQDVANPYCRGYATLEYFNADTLVCRQHLFLPQPEIPVELVHAPDGYHLSLNDTLSNWNYSLCLTKLTDTLPFPDIRYCLDPPAPSGPIDSSFLCYQGTVRKNKRHGHLIQDKDLVLLIGKDSLQRTQLVHVDSSGNLSLSGLFFYDSLDVNFMINKSLQGRPEEMQWTVNPPMYRPFSPPDSFRFSVDTLKAAPAYEWPTFDTIKYLKAAIVTERYADRNNAIDNRYTKETPFNWPAHFTFDMTKADARHPTAILDYLVHELPGFALPPAGAEMMKDSSIPLFPTFRRHPATFYLNGQLVNWKTLSSQGQVDIAYVKVLEDKVDDSRFIRQVSEIPMDQIATFKNPLVQDYTPSAMICIWTRAGKDLRGIPGQLNKLSLKGFNKPLPWTKPDRTTALWIPFIRSQNYLLPITGKGPYRLIAEGVSTDGRTFHFEKTIQ